MNLNKKPLLILLIIYGFMSLLTYVTWKKNGINSVTGDEPHYLVIASGIIKNGTLEQSKPYETEFNNRRIYKPGLAPAGSLATESNTHAVLGPNGLFNVHNIGLPLLLALPFLIGGVSGAKIFMIGLGALIVWMSWRFSGAFSEDTNKRFWAVLLASISLPLVPGSNQIYPDLLAGLISLVGLYWVLTSSKVRTKATEAILAAAVSFLPWLQIKFSATCVILVLAVTTKIYFESKNKLKILRILVTAGLSAVLLVTYNLYAFGSIFGPYQTGALEISKTSLMVLLGLHLDQNHGFLFQNPIYFIGLLSIGWMLSRYRHFAVLWMLVFCSLIVPNALHPNWYGGSSFSGRFQWAAAIVFIVPTLYGLLILLSTGGRFFKTLIYASLGLQLYFWSNYLLTDGLLYNKVSETWLDTYSVFYFPIHWALPAMYNSKWAFEYWPNYWWILFSATIFSLGFKKVSFSFRGTSIVLVLTVITFCIASFVSKPELTYAIFEAANLPSQVGRAVGAGRFAIEGSDQQGFVSYGPYFPLRRGKFIVTFTYKSRSDVANAVGWIDVYNATRGRQVMKNQILGTADHFDKVVMEFEVSSWQSQAYEFRVFWNGESSIELKQIRIDKL